MSLTWEKLAIFIFGVVFVSVLVLIAIAIPRPTEFQTMVFRIVLSLSAAGVGALVPGLLTVKISSWVRAGGAMAVLVIVYFFNPATLVLSTEDDPTDPFTITIIVKQIEGLEAHYYDFPLSDIRTRSSGQDFVEIVNQIVNQISNESIVSVQESTIFRVKDERTISEQEGDAVSKGNTGVIVIPNSVIDDFETPHLAFTFIHSQTRNRD